MVNANYNIFPQDGESGEQYAHRFQEVILAEDWSARFSTHGVAHRLLGKMLDAEQDPTNIIELARLRQESLVRGLGAGAICLWQRDVIAQRQAFEAQFDQ